MLTPSRRRCRRQRVALERVVFLALGEDGCFEVILRLQADPELRMRTQHPRQADGGIRRDGAPLLEQLCDAARWEAGGGGELDLRHGKRFQEVPAQDAAWMRIGQTRRGGDGLQGRFRFGVGFRAHDRVCSMIIFDADDGGRAGFLVP